MKMQVQMEVFAVDIQAVEKWYMVGLGSRVVGLRRLQSAQL